MKNKFRKVIVYSAFCQRSGNLYFCVGTYILPRKYIALRKNYFGKNPQPCFKNGFNYASSRLLTKPFSILKDILVDQQKEDSNFTL